MTGTVTLRECQPPNVQISYVTGRTPAIPNTAAPESQLDTQPSESTSACSSTVSVALSCLSGG